MLQINMLQQHPVISARTTEYQEEVFLQRIEVENRSFD